MAATAQRAACALELRGVSAGYGRAQVLRGISLAVPHGATLALLGANGAGKTTTLRTIAGALQPTAGSVHLDGQRIDALPPWEIARSGVGWVPEGRGIFPGLSVGKNLELAQFAGGNGSGLSPETAELFPRLSERISQPAGTLSGGEQQMLAVARVLESNPQVLLLDELSMGLAPILARELFSAVWALRERGATIVLVEQFVSEALKLADIVALLVKGQIAFFGEPGELEHAESDLAAAYIGKTGA